VSRAARSDLERFEHGAGRHRAASGAVDPGELRVGPEAAARPVDRVHLAGHGQARGPQAGLVGHQHDGAGAERREARTSDAAHQEPPEVTLPDPPDADGELVGGCSAESPALWSELDVSVRLDWSVLAVVLAWLAACPGRARAAMAENAAVSASAPASSQRVSRDTRWRPASRWAAPRSDGMKSSSRSDLDTRQCPQPAQGVVEGRSRTW
jgi:hypothetical protein